MPKVFQVLENHTEGSLAQITGPYRVSASVGLGWGPRILVSYKIVKIVPFGAF